MWNWLPPNIRIRLPSHSYFPTAWLHPPCPFFLGGDFNARVISYLPINYPRAQNIGHASRFLSLPFSSRLSFSFFSRRRWEFLSWVVKLQIAVPAISCLLLSFSDVALNVSLNDLQSHHSSLYLKRARKRIRMSIISQTGDTFSFYFIACHEQYESILWA